MLTTSIGGSIIYLHLLLYVGDVKQRLNLNPQLPPRPSSELEVFAQVALYNLESQPLILQFLVVLSAEVTSDVGLHPGDNFAETVVTEFFHLTQDTSPEEDLGVTQSVQFSVELGGRQNDFGTLLGVALFADFFRAEDFVPVGLTKILLPELKVFEDVKVKFI